jgi:drug/metabolite transporter (DMT)-like permease
MEYKHKSLMKIAKDSKLSGNERTMKSRWFYITLLIVTAVLWSFGGVLIKYISWDPFAIAGTRSTIAVPVIVIYMLLYAKNPRISWSFPQIGGAVAYAATVILFVAANKLTTAANAIVLQYTSPVYVAVFATLFLGEKAGGRAWLAVVLSVAGIGMFFMDEIRPGNAAGNAMALVSGVTLALMVVFMRMQKDGFPAGSVLLGNILTAMVCLPLVSHPMYGVRNWCAAAFLGIFQLGLSYTLYSIAIRHLPALESILVPIIEPLLNPVWVLLFIGEKPGPWALAGSAVVLFTVSAYCVLESRNPKEGKGAVI